MGRARTLRPSTRCTLSIWATAISGCPLDDDRPGKLLFTPDAGLLTRLVDSNEGKELQFYDSESGRLLGKYISNELVLDELTDVGAFPHTHATGRLDLGNLERAGTSITRDGAECRRSGHQPRWQIPCIPAAR